MSSEQKMDVFTEVIERDRRRIIAIGIEIKKLEHDKIGLIGEMKQEVDNLVRLEEELKELRNQDGRVSEHEEALREKISELYEKMPNIRSHEQVHPMEYEEALRIEKEIHELQENGIEGCDQQLHELYKRIKAKAKEVEDMERNIEAKNLKIYNTGFTNGISYKIEALDKERQKLEAEIEQMLVGVKQLLLKMGQQ